jgi:hypothetical protein
MRTLRYLLAIAMVCGLIGVAKADDFQMVVIDPSVPIDLIQPIFSDNFTLSFPTSGAAAGCKASQLPGISDPQDYQACFTGINLTGSALTDLQIEIPVFTGQPDTPSCPAPATSEFTDVACGLTNGGLDYLLQFSGGDIPNATLFNSFCYFDPFGNPGVDCNSAAIFTIAIGIPTPAGDVPLTPTQINEDFNTGTTAAANVVLAPEPSSIMLMATGVLSLGLFGAFRRRQVLGLARPSRSNIR